MMSGMTPMATAIAFFANAPSSAMSTHPSAPAGEGRTQMLIAVLFILVLASLYGFEIIQKVPATLHTPLMSGSNAISGITIIGAIICSDTPTLAGLAPILGFFAIIFAMINVVGGFVVTDRMLKMFKRK